MSKPRSEYDKIREVWYKKLEDSGFYDIESSDDKLKVWSSRITKQALSSNWQATAEYYKLANEFLDTVRFKSNLDRIIWEYHANALSARDITKILNQVQSTKTNRTTVWLTIRRLKARMFKKYNIK